MACASFAATQVWIVVADRANKVGSPDERSGSEEGQSSDAGDSAEDKIDMAKLRQAYQKAACASLNLQSRG